MATNFPSSKDTVGPTGSLPVETSGTPLSVSHIAAHQNVSDAIIALETKVGVDSSSDATTLDYKLKNSGSVNPGHLHTMAAGMSDVAFTGLADGNVLVWNATLGKWINNTTSAPDSSTTVKGIVKLSTAPVSSTSPIAVGDNDTRVPTVSQTAALAGTSGTAPSGSNKFVDNADNRLGAGPGEIVIYAGSSAPTGFLLCDGSAVSRTTYANLFAIIGTTYGAGNGTTTFNLPNIQGSFVAGYKSGDANFGTLGTTGGAKTTTFTPLLTTSAATPPANQVTNVSSGNSTPLIGVTGASTTANILPPFITLNYIIRT